MRCLFALLLYALHSLRKRLFYLRIGRPVRSYDVAGNKIKELLGNTGRDGAMLLIDRRRLYEARGRDAL